MSCMAALRVLREEFRLNKVGFGGIQTERFYIFQWRLPPFVYLLYRLVLSIYTLTWLFITSRGQSNRSILSWGTFLTNWTYTALTTYLLTHCVAAFLHHGYRLFQGESWLTRPDSATHNGSFKVHVNISNNSNNFNLNAIENGREVKSENEDRKETKDSKSSDDYLKTIFFVIQAIVWFMLNVVSTAALLVTLVFWTILFPSFKSPHLSLYDVQIHILNTVFVLLEHCVTGVPVRLLHVIYPVIYLLIYCLFTLIFWTGDNSRVIYAMLNWNHPGTTVGWIFGIGLIVIPLSHSLYYGIYRIKVAIHQKLCIS